MYVSIIRLLILQFSMMIVMAFMMSLKNSQVGLYLLSPEPSLVYGIILKFLIMSLASGNGLMRVIISFVLVMKILTLMRNEHQQIKIFGTQLA